MKLSNISIERINWCSQKTLLHDFYPCYYCKKRFAQLAWWCIMFGTVSYNSQYMEYFCSEECSTAFILSLE